MSPIRIVVSDANRMGCELLCSAILRDDDNFNVVGSATTVSELLVAVQSDPDVVLLSENLEDGRLGGFIVLSELRTLQPATRVVMLFDSSDRDSVITAFRGGAKGLFVRRHPIDTLCKCIRKVHEGEIWASHTELHFLLEAVSNSLPIWSASALGQQGALLTKREEQIVQLVAQGLMNREISRKLNLSEHTVKNYLFRIYDKLGVSSRVELTLYVVGRVQGQARKAAEAA